MRDNGLKWEGLPGPLFRLAVMWSRGAQQVNCQVLLFRVFLNTLGAPKFRPTKTNYRACYIIIKKEVNAKKSNKIIILKRCCFIFRSVCIFLA